MKLKHIDNLLKEEAKYRHRILLTKPVKGSLKQNGKCNTKNREMFQTPKQERLYLAYIGLRVFLHCKLGHIR